MVEVWMVEVQRNTTSRPGSRKLVPTLCHSQLVNGNLSGFAMDLQLEPLSKQSLQHGPPHEFLSWGSFGFGLNGVSIRTDPGRASLDWLIQKPHGDREQRRPARNPNRKRLAIRVQKVCIPDETVYRLALQNQPSRRRSASAAARVPSATVFTGGDRSNRGHLEFRDSSRRLGDALRRVHQDADDQHSWSADKYFK